MFKKIAATIVRPGWQKGTRYECLDLRDRILDGTFYDCLPHGFYDEQEGNGAGAKSIPLIKRRPSAQYRLARMVARWSARKLFAGRHVPKVHHDDKGAKAKVEALIAKGHFFKKMMEITMRGSVGSVGATFRVDRTDVKDPKVAIEIWPAKFCKPVFDSMGGLEALSVRYTVRGYEWLAMGYVPAADEDFDANEMYWFVRDYGAAQEITYAPVLSTDWNPVEGFTGKNVSNFTPWSVVEHELGFCPAHWFTNLSGGSAMDGACTFEDAIPTSIELDYLLSQASRGTRYNCAPQLTIVGDMMGGEEEGVTRDVASYIHLQAAKKDEDGNSIGGGEARLLEMSGAGVETALKLIDTLHKYALEQISAMRKDPEKMKGTLSGRAMEYLDEDSHDLVMELRSNYGEYGFLPFLRKIVAAALEDVDASQLSLQWPRLYTPTPDDVFTLINAMVLAVSPIGEAKPGGGKGGGNIGAGGGGVAEGGTGRPGKSLVDIEHARVIINSLLDLNLIDVDVIADQKISVAKSGEIAPDPIACEGGGYAGEEKDMTATVKTVPD